MMKPFEEFRFQGREVPEQMRSGITLYVEKQIEPGSCLLAILENDLREAVARADDDVMWALPVIVAYLYNEIPGGAWGSKAKVAAWLDMREVEA